MTSLETGQNPVNDDQLRQFVEAIKLIEPYCVVDVVPNSYTYETELDVRDIEAIPADIVTAEVSIDKSSIVTFLDEEDDEELIGELQGKVDFGITTTEASVNPQGRREEVSREYAVFVFPPKNDGENETLEPYQTETLRLEDEDGRMRTQWGPGVEKATEAHYLNEAGELEDARRAQEEAGQLFVRGKVIEEVVGTRKYQLQQHLAAMAIVHKIHEKLGIQVD